MSASREFSLGSGATQQRRTGGDWSAVEKTDGDGSQRDYLAELGQGQNYNINVDHGQNWTHADYLFTGERLGHKSDIADGSLRNFEFRSLDNIVGEYYIAPRFLETVALHIAKNIFCDQGSLNSRVPLVLGIWGAKGQGKSFQTELAFKKLGVVPIIMSAGELESENAGAPGRLIRDRYRKAASVIRNQGKLSCLLINDLDAGIGRFGETQCTVNNQMVVGTLMNICDDPNLVSDGSDWREDASIPRVPIIVTGNDFSRVYAPLIRDGRMDKFYWNPTEEDLVSILHAMYKDDGLSREDMVTLLTAFPGQPLDFYGAIRASAYDNIIRQWIFDDVFEGRSLEDWEGRHANELRRRLLQQSDLPDVSQNPVTMEKLLTEGRRLVQEQEHVMSNRLSEEYLTNLKREKVAEAEMAREAPKPEPEAVPPPPPSQAAEEKLAAARKTLLEAGFVERVAAQEVEEEEQGPWPRVEPAEAMRLFSEEGYHYIDVRPAKDFSRDSFKKAVNIPAVQVSGFGASAVVTALDSFCSEVQKRYPDKAAKLLVVGGHGGEYAGEALEPLLREGYSSIVEVKGGFPAWSQAFRPNGEPRAAAGGWMSADGREELFGTGG